MSLFEGIIARTVPTSRLKVNVLERAGQATDGPAIVLVHGNVSSSLFWQEVMLQLPRVRLACRRAGILGIPAGIDWMVFANLALMSIRNMETPNERIAR